MNIMYKTKAIATQNLIVHCTSLINTAPSKRDAPINFMADNKIAGSDFKIKILLNETLYSNTFYCICETIKLTFSHWLI